MGLLRFVTKGISKVSSSLQGRCDVNPSDRSSVRETPGESIASALVNSTTSSNVVKIDAPEEYQPAVLSKTPNEYQPSGPSESMTQNINTLSTNTTGKAESKQEFNPENKQEIAQIILQNKRKYICASCELDPKILDIVNSNKMASCFFCNSNEETQKLLNQVKKHERDISGLGKMVKDKNKQIEALQKDLKRKEDEASRLKETVKAQTRELGSLETGYAKLKADYQKNENEIRKLQKTESAMRRQGDVLMDEQAKTLILDILRTKIKAICRIYLKDIRWRNVLATVNEQQLKSILGSIFSPSWHPASWPLIRDHPNISTQTLVTALLSCTISKIYFQNPFFRCGDARDTLSKIYDASLLKYPEASVIWRAKTTTLLKDISYDKGVTTTTTSDIIVKRIFNSIETLIQTENLREGKYMNDLENKIFDLVHSSIDLATDWHSREFHFEVISYEWLYYMKFDVYSEETSKYATPFPASRKLEGGKLYGILAVISPGFIRYLKGEGETEFKEIVWEKASVLLSENPVNNYK
ncbi:hypothetical protein TWF506_009718 [Arthrobotrys conoides]|uniref:Uncharacterized protein n=1 Tax=Arthrobotrys conoides TaxID=74498 RepID=A0AAN8NFY3_9PEZI